jgi:hypothetical protein
MQQPKSFFSRTLESIEDLAPSGMIVAVVVTLVFEGFFQYIFWYEMFPRLVEGHRHYAAGSIATFIGMFRLWFLVMSSRDIAAGNIRVAVLGITASVGLMVYCIWECYHIGARWSDAADRDVVVAMLVFTTCIVIVAEVRLMMSRYGGWRNSAAQAARAIALAEAGQAAAEEEAQTLRSEVERLLGTLSAQEAFARSEMETAEAKRAAHEAESLERLRQLRQETESDVARHRDYSAELERKCRELESEAEALRVGSAGIGKLRDAAEAEALALRSELEALRRDSDRRERDLRSELAELRAGQRRNPNGTRADGRGGSAAGTASNWPEALASAHRKFREEKGRNPNYKELAFAAGTSDKTEREYRERYEAIIKQQQ